MNTINLKYHEECNRSSDINEHLPTLKRYSEECDTIIEMGVRAIVSTWAFLEGNPKSLISYDLYHPSHYGSNLLPIVEQSAREKGIDYKFIQADVLTVEIPECDLLFIDTLHTYNQTKQELKLHSSKVKKYIIFHDTEAFRYIGENNEKGIWYAVEEFLAENKEWDIKEIYSNNNGITIIYRK